MAEIVMKYTIVIHQLLSVDVNERMREKQSFKVTDSSNRSLFSSLPTCSLAVERLSKTPDRFKRLKKTGEMSHALPVWTRVFAIEIYGGSVYPWHRLLQNTKGHCWAFEITTVKTEEIRQLNITCLVFQRTLLLWDC